MKLDTAALNALAGASGTTADVVRDVVTDALTSAYQARADALAGTVVVIDDRSGAFLLQDTSSGDTSPTPTDFSRLAAGAARQALQQFTQDQARRKAVGPWADLEGTVVRGIVTRAVPARGKVAEHLMLRVSASGATGTADAVLPVGEAIAGEDLAVGSRTLVLLLAANVDDRGRVRLTVSRRQPAFVSELLRTHVAAVADGRLEVTSVARDPGSRTKVALRPASLTGPGGVVTAAELDRVVDDLGGELLDVVAHHPDLAGYVAAALTPAQGVRAVLTDPARRQVTAHVGTDQLAAARGREDSNVRLAQRLTGARISVAADPATATRLAS